eukprot:UN05711
MAIDSEIKDMLEAMDKVTIAAQKRVDRDRAIQEKEIDEIKNKIGDIKGKIKDIQKETLAIVDKVEAKKKELEMVDPNRAKLRIVAEQYLKQYDGLVKRIDNVKSKYYSLWEKWTNVEVLDFLKNEGFGDKHLEIFKEGKIQGHELGELTAEELGIMGLKKAEDKEKVLKCIQKLKDLKNKKTEE